MLCDKCRRMDCDYDGKLNSDTDDESYCIWFKPFIFEEAKE